MVDVFYRSRLCVTLLEAVYSQRHEWNKRISIAWLYYPHWFGLIAQRCSSCWRHDYPSDSCIIKYEVAGAFCPQVLCLCQSEVCSCDVSPLSTVQEHVDSMLISLIPLTVFPHVSWEQRWDKTPLSVWMSTSPPPSLLPVLCVLLFIGWLGLIYFSFLFALVRNDGNPKRSSMFNNP